MAELKREVIKMVRDFIKKDYKPKECCYICGSLDSIELHHLYGVSELFNTWVEKNKIRLDNTVEQIKELRVTFAQDNAEALGNDNLYNLCKKHHTNLHSIYGQRYSNSMGLKVKNWIEIQRSKYQKEQ